MALQGLGEIVDVLMHGHIARIEMHLGHPLVVAGDETVQDFGQEQALLGAKPAHDAEVEGHELALRGSTIRLP